MTDPTAALDIAFNRLNIIRQKLKKDKLVIENKKGGYPTKIPEHTGDYNDGIIVRELKHIEDVQQSFLNALEGDERGPGLNQRLMYRLNDNERDYIKGEWKK